MVKKIILILLLIPTVMLGQTKKLELGLMIGNNGQLDNPLNGFYRLSYYNPFVIENYNTNATSISYSTSARYFFSDQFSVRLKLGKAKRNSYVIQSSPNTFWDYKSYQSIENISPSVCFSKRFKKFELMTGLEIPFMNVGDYKEKRVYSNTPTTGPATNDEYTTTITGGFIWGFNNFIGAEYYFTKAISIGAEINYGLLFSRLGGNYKVEYNKSSTHQYNVDNSKKVYKNNFFSSPELSIGVFVLLGKNEEKVKDK